MVLLDSPPLVDSKVYAISLALAHPLPQPNTYNRALTIVQGALSAPLLGRSALRKIVKTSGVVRG